MELETVLQRLRAHEADLRASGVESISVFGSTARGEAAPDSDVDLAAHITPGAWRGLTGLVQLRRHLTHIVGHEVDIFEAPVRKPRMAADVERDQIVAF